MTTSALKISSNINILGGYENLSNLPAMLAQRDVFANERTLSSKKRYQKAIEEVFLSFNSVLLKRLFVGAMGTPKLNEDARLRIMALQFYSNDDLFHLLFNTCFLPIFKSGRMSINKHDVIAFLDEQIRNETIDVEWSRETIDTVSRKYLTVLKKLGFLDGKVKKTIKEPYVGTDFLIFFHHWLVATEENRNVFQSPFFPFLMLSKEKYHFLMKQPEVREKLDWHFTGEKFTVEPKMSLTEYINELSS